jgi:hypothetical protein
MNYNGDYQRYKYWKGLQALSEPLVTLGGMGVA